MHKLSITALSNSVPLSDCNNAGAPCRKITDVIMNSATECADLSGDADASIQRVKWSIVTKMYFMFVVDEIKGPTVSITTR